MPAPIIVPVSVKVVAQNFLFIVRKPRFSYELSFFWGGCLVVSFFVRLKV